MGVQILQPQQPRQERILRELWKGTTVTFDEVMEHIEDLLKEAEKAIPTGSVQTEDIKTRIYITIVERWVKVAEVMQEQFVLTERKKEIDRNHEYIDKHGLFPGLNLNMGEGPDVGKPDDTGAYR